MTTQHIPMKQHFEAKPLCIEQKQLIMHPNLPFIFAKIINKTEAAAT